MTDLSNLSPAVREIGDDDALYLVQPVLIKRQCPGWLAVTPRGWPLSVGVTGWTEGEARTNFFAAMQRWAQIPMEPSKP